MANPFLRIDLAFAAFVAALFLIGAAAEPAAPPPAAAAPAPAPVAAPAVARSAMPDGCCGGQSRSCPLAGAHRTLPSPATLGGASACPRCTAHALADH